MNKIGNDFLASAGLLYDLILFLFVTLTTLSCWAIVIVISNTSPIVKLKNTLEEDLYWLCILMLHITFVIGVNSFLYPTSLSSYFRHSYLSDESTLIILGFVLTILFFRGVLSLNRGKALFLISSLTMLILYPFYFENEKKTVITDKPNIIILGIDGLRPDHLEYFGAQVNLAPNLNKILERFNIYKYSYTPQGRTYVAWMSILTGKYPVNNNVRFNLAPPEAVDKELPIVKILKNKGYYTSYAIDERRFNQIDYDYGFDNIVGPKVGAADAIISGFGDLPFLNILLQHPYSEVVLPYLYNNRAYGKAYSPDLFNNQVVKSLDINKPNFLSIHLCQLHWPYTSIDFVRNPNEDWDGNYNHYMYKEMLKSVDRQVEDLFVKLEKKGLLKNAYVYLISDHGESFNQHHYMPVNISEIDYKNTKSWGHGTNILDQQQSHVLLAKAYFKNNKTNSKTHVFSSNQSLVNIVPSIIEDLNLAKNTITDLDGFALPNKSTNKEKSNYIFVESSVPVKSINKSFIDKKQVMSETASNYELRNDGKAYMKLESYYSLIAKKQRSVYFESWQLAMIPNTKELILFNKETNKIYSHKSYNGEYNWQPMLTALCKQYKGDIGFDKYKLCDNSNNILATTKKHLN